MGGHPGFQMFFRDVTDATHVPKSIANGGSTGQTTNAVPCKSNAAQVHISGEKRLFAPLDVQFQKHVPEPRCPENVLGSTEPIPAQQVRQPLNIATEMIAYKAVLVENMNNFAYKYLIEKVYKAIESNAQVNQAYTISAYATEANSLERLFSRLNKDIDMYPLYRSLMERIDGYSAANGNNVTEIDRRVLSLLYTMAVGKAASIRSSHKSDLIVDVLQYLDVALHNVAKLDDVGRMRVISEVRDQYKDELASKIKEAKNYVSNDVEPEIAAVFRNLNVEMERTVNETIELEKQTIKEIQRKEELAKKLREKSSLQKFLGVVGTVASVCSTFISYAGIAAGAINAIAGWVGERVPDVDTKDSFVFRMRTINSEEIDAMEKQLNSLREFVNGSGGANKTAAVSEIAEKIGGFAEKLTKIKLNPTFGATRTILTDVLEFVNKPLAAIKRASDQMTKDFLKPFERATHVLSVVASSISTYKKYANNDAKLDEIGKAIQQDRETLKALMAFEHQVYDKLIPVLNVMQFNLRNVSNNLTNQSLVALDVQKWKIAP